MESISKASLFWRSFSHWIGGMGILVFVLAVLPAVEERSIHIMRAEVPGPQVSKLVPRTRNTAAILYCIYLAMTVLLILLLVLGDMPLFDAAVHAFGAAGTGGFGIKNTSIGWYDSAYVDVVIGIFMILPLLIANACKQVIHSDTIMAILEGVIRIAIFIAYIKLISRMEDIRRTFMYHGAEHKCINCVEHGLDLNVENVKKSSRFHKRCGTSFLFLVVFISILFFACIRTDSAIWRFSLRILLVPVIAGVAYEFLRLAGRSENAFVNLLSKPGLWFQKFTTKEPDEDMIEVAIASVEAVFDWKPYVEKVRGEGAAEAD